ncbi:hypothetical protein [Roseiflexus castenholzii]|uniref:Membrane protein 6-pyruvoyl-tetrahydropterin synthase-related domain-containing protein n=1 Tax=Roseiflexus castenholzii (strain DSM 13941 / HLO8) TaxID=383372 RepID=A7NRA2_ROSCS|nr:hypothetical protein [Roseiflexus castenholzii]ABU60098.1 conserved hypothetical protein [Roseiflexus castenholzii DSM 13941]
MASITQHTPRVAVFPHLIALALYTLLGILLTWPLLLNLTNGVIGAVDGVDAYQNAWSLWWTAQALTSLRNPFFSPLLFYPDGVDLFWQPLGFSQGVLALPVTLTLGPVAAVNWIVLTSFTVGGYATFLLARRVTGNAAAALVAGATFICSPYHMEKVIDGNLEVAAIHWLPCYAYALLALLDRPSWRRALAAGALLVWVSLGSWYYGLFAVLFTACAAGIWAYGATRNAERMHQLQRGLQQAMWGVAPLVILVMAIAPALYSLVTTGADEMLWDMRSIQRERSADLIDAFLPNPVHPVWGPAVRAWRNQIYPNAVIWNVSLGWIALGLGLLGATTAWRATWRWSLLALACFIVALGPELKIAGWHTGLPLPYTLIQDMPVIRSGQRPNHMMVMVSLSLSILAAYGFTVLQQHLIQHPSPIHMWSMALALIVPVAGIDGYAGTHTIVARRIHPFYATLPPPDGAIIALPLYLNVNRSENLTAQIGHGWPIIGGYVARPPAYVFPKYTPGVREIQFGEVERQDVVSPGWPESARRALAAYRIRYITMDLQSNKDEYFARLRPLLAELGIETPVFVDETLEVYAVPQAWRVVPVAFLGDGWQPLEREPATGVRWRWMGERAEVRLFNPLVGAALVRLTFWMEAYYETRPLWYTLNNMALGTVTVPSGRAPARAIYVLLPPGDHVLTLQAPADPDPARAGAPISIRLFALDVRSAAGAP